MKITNKNHKYNKIFYALEIKKHKIDNLFKQIPPSFILKNHSYFNLAFEHFTSTDYELIKKCKCIKAINTYLKLHNLDQKEQHFWINESLAQKLPIPILERNNFDYYYGLNNVFGLERLLANNYTKDLPYDDNKKMDQIYVRRLALNPVDYIFEISAKHSFLDVLAIKHAYSSIKFDYQHFMSTIQKIHKTKPSFYTCYLLRAQPTKKMLKEQVNYNMIGFLTDKNFLTCCFEYYLQHYKGTKTQKVVKTDDITKLTDRTIKSEIGSIFVGHNRKINDIKEFVLENVFVPEKVAEFLAFLTGHFDKSYDFLQVFIEGDLDYRKYQRFFERAIFVNHKIVFDIEKIKYFMGFPFYRNNLMRNFDPLNYKTFLFNTQENINFLNKYFYGRADIKFYVKMLQENKISADCKDSKLSFSNNFMLLLNQEAVLHKKRLRNEYYNSFRTPSVLLTQTKLGILFIMMNYKQISKETMIEIVKCNKTIEKGINNVLDLFLWNKYDDVVSLMPYFKKIHDNTLESIINNKKQKIDFAQYLKYKSYEKECIEHIKNNYTLPEILKNYYFDESFVLKCLKHKMSEDFVNGFEYLYNNIRNNDNIIYEMLEMTTQNHSRDIFTFLAKQEPKNINFIDCLARKYKSLSINYFLLFQSKCTINEAQVLLRYKNDMLDLIEDNSGNTLKTITTYNNNPIETAPSLKHDIARHSESHKFVTIEKASSNACETTEEHDKIDKGEDLQTFISFLHGLNTQTNLRNIYDENYVYVFANDPVLAVDNIKSLTVLLQIYNFYKPFVFYHFDLILQNLNTADKKLSNVLKEYFLDDKFVLSVKNKIKAYLEKCTQNTITTTEKATVNCLLSIMNNKFGYFTDDLFALLKTISYSKPAQILLKTTEVEDYIKLPNKEMIQNILNGTFEYFLDKRSEKILLYKLKEILVEIKKDKTDIQYGKNVLKIVANLHNIVIGYEFLSIMSFIFPLLTDDRFIDEISEIFRQWVHFDKKVIYENIKMLALDLRIAKVLVSILLEIENNEEAFVEEIVMNILNISNENAFDPCSEIVTKESLTYDQHDSIKNKDQTQVSDTVVSVVENSLLNIPDDSLQVIKRVESTASIKLTVSHKKKDDLHVVGSQIEMNDTHKEEQQKNKYVSQITNEMLNFLAYAPSLRCFKKHKHLFIPLLKNVFLTPKFEIAMKSFIRIFDESILFFLVHSIFVSEKGFEALAIFEEVLKKEIAQNIKKLIFATIFVLKFSFVEKIKRKAFELWITYFKMGLIKEIMQDVISLVWYKTGNEDLFNFCLSEVFDKYNEIMYQNLALIIQDITKYEHGNASMNNHENSNEDDKNNISAEDLTGMENNDPANASMNNHENSNEDDKDNLSAEDLTAMKNNEKANASVSHFKHGNEDDKNNTSAQEPIAMQNSNRSPNIADTVVKHSNSVESRNKHKHLQDIYLSSFLMSHMSFDGFNATILQNLIEILVQAMDKNLYFDLSYEISLYKIDERIILLLLKNSQYKNRILDLVIKNKIEYEFLLENKDFIDKLFHKTKDFKILQFTSDKMKMKLLREIDDRLKNSDKRYGANQKHAIVSSLCFSIASNQVFTITDIFDNAVIDQNFDFTPFHQCILPSKEWESFLCSVNPFFSFCYLTFNVPDYGGLKNVFERTFDSVNCVDLIVDSFYCEYLKDVTFKNVKDYKKLFYIFLGKGVYKRFSEIFTEYYDDEMIIELLKLQLKGNWDVENVLKDIDTNKKALTCDVLNDYLLMIKLNK